MATKTEICNKALSVLGVGLSTMDVETETSTEAKACNLWYETTRDEILRDFAWPFATKRAVSLGLVEADPTDYWSFSYRYPSDCITIHQIDNGLRVARRDNINSFTLGGDDTGTLIYTNIENACVTYTFRHTNVSHYPPDFQHGLALMLASYIAPRLMGGDRFGMADKVLKLYLAHLTKVKANAANEKIDDVEPESTFISERNS